MTDLALADGTIAVTGGTYTLVLELDDDATMAVGALGELTFSADTYAYTGSALGAGGFARVDRHRDLAAGERDVRHWHVDYLLGHDATRVREIVTTDAAVECAVARRLPDGPRGFGASDCDCDGHLAAGVAVDPVRDAHEAVRDA